jgi:hypothetical protein
LKVTVNDLIANKETALIKPRITSPKIGLLWETLSKSLKTGLRSKKIKNFEFDPNKIDQRNGNDIVMAVDIGVKTVWFISRSLKAL